MADLKKNSSLRATLANLPKIDLHRHLEGSLRLATLHEIGREHGIDLPARSIEELRPYVQMTTDEPNYRNFLEKFNVIRRFYRSPETITRLTQEVIEDAARDNLCYLELRFTPMALANTCGYPLEDVTRWVIQAVKDAGGNFSQLHVELIASINRHEPLAAAERVTQIAADNKEVIVALDLAGDEANYPTPPVFEPLFREAKRAGLGITIHAGEWSGAAAVRYAIEKLGADRIGHGVRILEDPAVVDLARERGTVFEICITSNIHSGVIERLTAHPLRSMNHRELHTTINTDDPAISDITLTDEYQVALEDLGLSWAELKASILTAAAAAFQPPAERQKLVARFKTALADIGI